MIEAAAVSGVLAYFKYLLLMASLSRDKACGVEKLDLPRLGLNCQLIGSWVLTRGKQRGGKGRGTASEWSAAGLVSFCP